jgi:hypothetical protein
MAKHHRNPPLIPNSRQAGRGKSFLEDFVRTQGRAGQKCPECGVTFTVDHGDGKRLVSFPNGWRGQAFYVVCKPCGAIFEIYGPRALPNVWKDSCITGLISPYAKQNAPVWIH